MSKAVIFAYHNVGCSRRATVGAALVRARRAGRRCTLERELCCE